MHGRAASTRVTPAPSPSAATLGGAAGGSGAWRVDKCGALFVCTVEDGAIDSSAHPGSGLYLNDMRYLARLRWIRAVDGASISPSRRALSEAGLRDELEVPAGGLVLELAADFVDIFTVRGVVAIEAPRPPELRLQRDTVVFERLGLDGLRRSLTAALTVEPDETLIEGDAARLRWSGVHTSVELSVTCSHPARSPEGHMPAWWTGAEPVPVRDPRRTLPLATSVRDLGKLLTPIAGRWVFAAGAPWYVAAFGRDLLVTSLFTLSLAPQAARNALMLLASYQATADDPGSDAEPGKILHELRLGELARAGFVPSPYYGTADATALFVVLASEYERRTGDTGTVDVLWPAIESALAWIELHGDRDGDGFVEYRRRAHLGLVNQGWKDSEDSIGHAGGLPATGPIALCEVQGYTFMAKSRAAAFFDRWGEPARAEELRRGAAHLKDAFHRAFWMEREQTYALALDGNKEQVPGVTSNPGHLLWTGIIDGDRAAAVVRRLVAEDMFSGWGIRTLSSRSPAFDPLSYHNGSVWPHDTALIATGMAKHGFSREARLVANALFDAAAEFEDHRLPELFGGHDRKAEPRIVAYPGACSPQAWAAASLLFAAETLEETPGPAAP